MIRNTNAASVDKCFTVVARTYSIVFVLPLDLGQVHAAVVGLPPLLTVLVLHTITQ